MAEHVYPNEEDLFAQVSEGDRWQPVPLLDELKAKARAAGLWNLFLPESEYGAGLDQSRIRAALRDHGPLIHRRRDLQLLRAGHGQYGSAGALRHAGAAGSSGSSLCSQARSARPSP